jgi:trehalose-6-phosphatase
MIDYEGVIGNYAKPPSKEVTQALDSLSKRTNLMVTSDRTRADTAKWFEDCKKMAIGAENGFFYRLSAEEGGSTDPEEP